MPHDGGIDEHLVEAPQVAHRFDKMELGRDVGIEGAVACRQSQIEQQHLGLRAAACGRREIHGQAGDAHARTRAEQRDDLAVAPRCRDRPHLHARHHQLAGHGRRMVGRATKVDEVAHAGTQGGEQRLGLACVTHRDERQLRKQPRDLLGQPRRVDRARLREVEQYQAGPQCADLLDEGILRIGLGDQRTNGAQRVAQPVPDVLARGVEQEMIHRCVSFHRWSAYLENPGRLWSAYSPSM